MITITLSQTELRYIKHIAKNKEFGGKSQVRENREDTLSTDSLIGCIGEYAGSIYLTGDNCEFYKSALFSQRLRDVDVRLGDGGQDIIGLNLDFKTSRQHEDREPLKHWLAVRPHELRENWVYMLMLVMNNDEYIGLNTNNPVNVCVVGWASSEMLPKHTEDKGVFKGAHCLPATKLIQPMPIRWLSRV